MSTLIAVLHDSSQAINVHLAGWLAECKATAPKEIQLMFRYQQPVSVNRNAICNYFLKETTHEWLIMVDSDQVPMTNWLSMRDKGEKIIMALTTVGTSEGPMPLVMVDNGTGCSWRKISLTELAERIRENGLIHVDALGSGVLLIHRSVLEAIKPPWFEFRITEEGLILMSEDYDFSIKAKEAGFKLFIDSTAKAGHLKLVDMYTLNKQIYKIITAKSLKVETFGKDQKETKEENFTGLKPEAIEEKKIDSIKIEKAGE